MLNCSINHLQSIKSHSTRVGYNLADDELRHDISVDVERMKTIMQTNEAMQEMFKLILEELI